MSARIGNHDLTKRRGAKDGLEAHADQRREISARHLRRLGDPQKLRRQPSLARPFGDRREPARHVRRRVDLERFPIRGLGPDEILPLLEQLSKLDERCRIPWIEL